MKKWTVINKCEPSGNINTEKFNISNEIAQIMINRGITEYDDIQMFIKSNFEYLRDPFLLKDMEKAVIRIKKAIENREKICVFGDYDVDGVSSTSILILYFKHISYDVNYYIPNRLDEGYGLNKDAIEQIKSDNVDLIITVDCGITSVEEVEYAKKLGIDVIITDHHECQLELPNAVAVVDPKREDCAYPFKGICGCGVAFKLIHALEGDEYIINNIYRYLEIVSLATICDIMPVLDENRIIVKNGLDIIGRGNNIGMKALLEVCGLTDFKIKSSHLGFAIGPRINASGRLGFSSLGVELFTCDNDEKAKEIAELMNIKNEERQLIESKIYKEAENILSLDGSYEDDKVIVLASEGWHHGIIGIVASKLTEKYYKPCILLCLEDGIAVGSARSIKGFDIFDAMLKCKDYMLKFGGHEQAAGLSIEKEKIASFRKKINEIADFELEDEDLVEEIKIEYEIDEKKLNLKLVDRLHLLEPFGIKNPTPHFLIRDCYVKNIFLLGKDKNHLKILIEKEKEYECIGFGMSHLKEIFDVGDMIDVVCRIDENTFNGNTKIQLQIKDVRLSRPKDISLYPEVVKTVSKIINLDRYKNDDFNKNKEKNDTDFIEYNFIYDHMNNFFKNDNIDDIKKILSYENYEEYQEIRHNIENRNVKRDSDIIMEIDDNTVAIINTINGYFRYISDLNISNSEKNNIMFLSNIDKSELKVYNKIIIYDYVDNIADLDKIFISKNENSQIILNFNESDFIHLVNKFNEQSFNREKFVNAYKYLMLVESGKVDFDFFARTIDISTTELLIILDVLKNENLIDYNIDFEKGEFVFKILPKPANKLDLKKNRIIVGINETKQKFENTYKI
ncbi:single-stranded-DNA-specific exonuclease RecJ [Peptostreptococcus canis]|uniref:Single-stranded-DNA-specific exonuclease RecJ n=1 Tax=Peptostreptococcus canis TaxID=1159213 RepID=A0ABR6TL31_9FIRM|nr:single-stranded-DNA-specific exonuclease RecJ [Peptostreptococcus canis]MBC2575948.1 single-stranded-DNA-specific exonuclease RecJ [Peptostreptococcus canis]MBP1997930.1 single-stranded-DNA-specific exonuclease [Peptostreptococcus canis]